MAWATIQVAGTYKGTVADDEGRFSLQVPAAHDEIRVGAIGYTLRVRRYDESDDDALATERLRIARIRIQYVG